MRIDELIEHLKKVQKRHPDIVVYVRDHIGSEQAVWYTSFNTSITDKHPEVLIIES